MSAGKWTEINAEANKIIKKQCDEKHIHTCEIKLDGCMGDWELHPAHKHKRIWYKGTPELLSDFSQWVLSCPYCHDAIEYDEKLTKETFKKLRPKITCSSNVMKTNKPKAMAVKAKKADWMRPHACIHCKKPTSMLICNHCGELSIKTK